MTDFLSYYSSKYYDNFNDELVRVREKDDMIVYIDEFCRELEKRKPENIKYLGHRFDDGRSRHRYLNRGRKKKGAKAEDETKLISIHPTVARLVIFRFEVKFDDKISIEEMPIYIPMLIDKYHYMIRGNKYITPFQLSDSVTFSSKDNIVVFKGLNRAIKMSRRWISFKDVFGEEYWGYAFENSISRLKVSTLLFFFAHYGFVRTLRYFNVYNYVKFFDTPPEEPDDEFTYFKFGYDLFIGVNKQMFETDQHLKNFIVTMMLLNKRGMNLEMVQDNIYWLRILGLMVGASQDDVKRGREWLKTFITIADERSLRILNAKNDWVEIDDTFGVMKWMFFRFDILNAKSSGLQNKRLRLGEYLVNPVKQNMNAAFYRFMNVRKNNDINRLQNIFKINPMIIIDSMIGKSKSNSTNITKYSGRVNDLCIIQALKFTKSGPGSPFERMGSKRVGNQHREFDPSYVGKVCLMSTPTSDPGISGILTPFVKIDELMQFK